MNLRKEVKNLAEIMFSNQQTIDMDGWPDKQITFFYLPTEYHLLHSGQRGFGMKVSMSHKTDNKITVHDLEQELLNRWGQ